jgi:hypothetical protein
LAAACDEPAARIVNLSGDFMNTRNIAALELGLFGKARFKPGDTIELGSTSHCRADRVEWKGKFTLRE